MNSSNRTFFEYLLIVDNQFIVAICRLFCKAIWNLIFFIRYWNLRSFTIVFRKYLVECKVVRHQYDNQQYCRNDLWKTWKTFEWRENERDFVVSKKVALIFNTTNVKCIIINLCCILQFTTKNKLEKNRSTFRVIQYSR